ncbi:hypothetical protein B3286c2_0599 [Brucella vulpis]|uniref:hypothetical protein n=1 Tax=Brucella vulpis TaxID=981386 RepID=UPI00073ACAE9|nr:hypothetical protein BF3285c2_0604 [Brucella vulpis]CUW51615.1 hypothetical protein B3286c2_0599 [Brucella vulpis]
MRGKPMTLEQYYKREDEAALALVTTLADMPAEQAEANVRGMDESKPGPLIPIPSGIWPQTATSDLNDRGQLYRLIGTDDHDEWDAAILSVQLSGYRKIQVRSDFIKDNWPEDGKKNDSPVGWAHYITGATSTPYREDFARNSNRIGAAHTEGND